MSSDKASLNPIRSDSERFSRTDSAVAEIRADSARFSRTGASVVQIRSDSARFSRTERAVGEIRASGSPAAHFAHAETMERVRRSKPPCGSCPYLALTPCAAQILVRGSRFELPLVDLAQSTRQWG